MPWGKNVSNGDGTQTKIHSEKGETLKTADGQTDRHPHVHTYPNGEWVARDVEGTIYGSNEYAVGISVAVSVGLAVSSQSNGNDQ